MAWQKHQEPAYSFFLSYPVTRNMSTNYQRINATLNQPVIENYGAMELVR